MKHFVVEIQYTVPLEIIDQIVSDHRLFLQSGYDRGWLLCSGPLVPKTGGVVIARAPSKNDLETFFQDDPYFINGAASYRFTEFNPVKHQSFLEGWITNQ